MVNWRWIAAGSVAALFITTVILLAVLIPSSSKKQKGCELTIKPTSPFKNAPLLLHPKGTLDVFGFLEPNKEGRVNFDHGQQVLIACPGQMWPEYLKTEVLAECNEGTKFKVENKAVDISQLDCIDEPVTAVLDDGSPCGGHDRGSIFRIGYNISRGFIGLIEVCFVKENLEPIWSATTVRAHVKGNEYYKRPSFDPGIFYPKDVNEAFQYSTKTQNTTFTSILGSKELAARYIQPSLNLSLNHGHLVAKADLVWGAGQRATFLMGNVAPQWRMVNDGNWEKLESSVRNFCSDSNRDLLVVTGVWNRTMLPNVSGIPTPIALMEDGRMPVPAVFWKVVYDNTTRHGVAFVTVNNPHTQLALETRLRLCRSVCDQVTWVTWEQHNIARGESYCCEVNTLRASIADIPQLEVVGLLV